MFIFSNLYEFIIAVFVILWLALGFWLMSQVLRQKVEVGLAVTIIIVVAITGAFIIWQADDYIQARTFSDNVGSSWLDLWTKDVTPIK